MSTSDSAVSALPRGVMVAGHYWPETALSFVAILALMTLGDLGWGLVAATVTGGLVMLVTAIRWNMMDGDVARWWRLGLLALCNLLIGLLATYWVIAEGFVFTRDFGESFSVFLAARNASDFVTLLLQDMSTDSIPTGHPFLYTHQPSFVARLSSIVFQALGFGIPANMAFNFMAVTMLLWVMANELRRILPWPVVVGGTTFAACGYAVFHENIVDLTRAPGYFALFGGVAILAREPDLRARASRIALAALVAVAAASDFLVCVFVVYVLSGIYLWMSQRFRVWRLLACFVLPCVLFYAVYFGTVAAVVGLNFFVVDILYSYFGRAGQLLPALGTLGWIPNLPESLQEIPRFYQEAGIVLWQRPSRAFGAESLVVEVGRIWHKQAGLAALVMGIAAVASLIGSVASYRRWRLAATGGGTLAAICVVCQLPLLVLLLIPLGFLVLLPGLARPGRMATWLAGETEEARRVQNTLVFGAIAAMGVLAAASVFPEYGIQFIISEGRGVPAPFLEMVSFGLAVYLASRLAGYGQSANGGRGSLRLAIATGGITLLALLIGAVINTNLSLFRASPPRAPNYAKVLSRPEYRHQPFVTTSFYGQVWYFTRGWAYMVPNPPLKPFVEYWHLRHLRDWQNVDKYGRPGYFLCDNTHLKGYSITFGTPRSCSATQSCTCVDVAEYMRDQGYAPLVVRPDFAIVDVRNPDGLLHRASAMDAAQSRGGLLSGK